MYIIHGTWVPEPAEAYFQKGHFYLWVECNTTRSGKYMRGGCVRTLQDKELQEFLEGEVNLKKAFKKIYSYAAVDTLYFTLPSLEGKPLQSYDMLPFSEYDYPDKFEWQTHAIGAYRIPASYAFSALKHLHFLSSFYWSEIRAGSDLLFWYDYSRSFRKVIAKDRYIPALRYEALDSASPKRGRKRGRPKGKTKKNSTAFKIHPAWEIISEAYESDLEPFAAGMPLICVAGSKEPLDKGFFFVKEDLLRHFSENVLLETIRDTPFTKSFDKRIEGTLLEECLYKAVSEGSHEPLEESEREERLELYKKWRLWRDRFKEHQIDNDFFFCFKLEEPASKKGLWKIVFQLQSKADPSFVIPLKRYWNSTKSKQKSFEKKFGKNLEKKILLSLGYAARIYPKLWDGMKTTHPDEVRLTTEEAYEFLKESAEVLKETDYKIIVPAWWTPEGRRKAKLRLKASSKKTTGSAAAPGKSFFGADALVQYQYELAIGDKAVSHKEWKELVEAKSPLVKFRGEWLEIEPEKMRSMLEFWEAHKDETLQTNVQELIKMAAGTKGEEFEFEHDKTLRQMLAKLHDKSRFKIIANPKKLKGKLRDYQKRGVSWIGYLENLGLNGCLADDMGLGKTIQVIARLVKERSEKQKVSPTLLVVPTSVIGNWYKEIEKFAPHLNCLIHHGSQRITDKRKFASTVKKYDAVITSFALARRDAELLQPVRWERVVLDEAQNIKNPKAAQTKAILKLKARHRLALTGTPVENRLMDLWSIFNFLNPGYLETQTRFRKTFELPIQKENDPDKMKMLKTLVEPFILRRVKTDKNIIKDLPDKIEQKVYCSLTVEQASLYEAVVQNILQQVEEAEGIHRKGLILSSLTKLKQICNHPAQFLQDNSAFSKERSYKLSRLAEMVQEALENGESLLIFSQYREIVEALNRFIREELHCRTFLLHGATRRKKREQMIAEFQDENTPPSVFLLSIKAGGVGITLTKANHVFHFDRWWNPAVEDQATDRAFRIGQKKNVFVHKFVTLGTLEERIDLMIEEKKKMSGAIVGNDESWLTELDNEAFKKLISLNKDAVWA